MQRLRQDDLIGHALEQEDWDLVRLPAIAEQDETHIIRTQYRTRTVTRNAGEALHPEREPLPLLEHLRRTLGEYNFAGQYQTKSPNCPGFRVNDCSIFGRSCIAGKPQRESAGS